MEIDMNQLMQFFTAARRQRDMDKLMSIPLSKCPQIEEDLQNLPKQLHELFYTLYTKEEESKPLNLFEILQFKQQKTPMPICNKLLLRSQVVYRCYNCMSHESAVLCMKCFQRGNHQGHRFTKIQSGGGNCDCGNPDAVLESGFCVDHLGRADEMEIEIAEQDHFREVFTQLFIWMLKLHKLKMKKQAELFLTHILDVLDKLNNESLYYNTLTNKLLFNWENPMIDHIFIIGSATDNNGWVARKGTELFLKMFSLDVFKENIAVAYLQAYNRLSKFQDTKFQSLFIQLFANNDLVQRIIQKSGISLDPRERQYNPNSYYSSLHFMGSIKEYAARAFFTPIIKNGGVHCVFMDQIHKCVQLGTRKIEQIYRQYINVENLYYSVSKVVLRLIKNTPELLQMQLRNQYALINKYQFNKNKVVLVYHRLFAMQVYVYFKCDYRNIDVHKLANILGINLIQMKEFLKKITKCFLHCLKELGRCIGNSGFPRVAFEEYVDLYCRSSNGNKVVLFDMMGIKICAVAFSLLKDGESFCRTLTEVLNEQANKEHVLAQAKEDWSGSDEEDYDDDQEQPAVNQDKPKSSQSAIQFYLGWLNTISIFVQAIIYDRAEVILTTELEITDMPIATFMYENQFKKIMLNAREMTMHQLDSLGAFWFAGSVNKAVIAKYAPFDRIKKKFVLKEDIKGIAIKRQLLKTFTKTPDHYLKISDQCAIEVTDQIRQLREIFFPSIFLQKFYKTLMAHLKASLDKQMQKYLKDMANHLKMMNILFEFQNQTIEDIIDVVIDLASDNQKLKNQISALFQTEKKEIIEQEQDKEKNEKRKELLRKKKEQKLKNFKNKQTAQKFLAQTQTPLQKQSEKKEQCIICHQCTSQKALYYLASTFSSNIVYSSLCTEGINPYFLSCFHQVHQDCFLSIAKQKEKIFCPLCKAMTNIIIPTQEYIENEKVFQTAMERIHVLFAMQYKKQFKNIFVQIMKSFIQLFFSETIDEGLVSQRQIKLFKLILDFCKQRYNRWSEQQQRQYIQGLLQVSSPYEKNSKEKYNIGLLIDFALTLASKRLKSEQITQQIWKQMVKNLRQLPKADMMRCVSLAQRVFDINFQVNSEQFMEQEGKKELKQFIYTFDPPKSIKALLQERKLIQNQNICKLGHNISICLICSWKGCLDCNTCYLHTSKVHNNDALYFNFITGGFYHHYNGIVINLRCLYVNDLGVAWKPKYQDEGFYFQIDVYHKMNQAVKSGNLIQFIRSNYQHLKIPDNNSFWSL